MELELKNHVSDISVRIKYLHMMQHMLEIILYKNLIVTECAALNLLTEFQRCYNSGLSDFFILFVFSGYCEQAPLSDLLLHEKKRLGILLKIDKIANCSNKILSQKFAEICSGEHFR